MNLIEALKKADGKPVRRESWVGSDCSLQIIRKGNSMYWLGGSGEDWREARIGFFADSALFADDWYVVEPKSKIEEAIEREMVAFYGLPVEKIIDGGGVFPAIINRIVNLTIDEAKKAAINSNHGGYIGSTLVESRIDALKVKE